MESVKRLNVRIWVEKHISHLFVEVNISSWNVSCRENIVDTLELIVQLYETILQTLVSQVETCIGVISESPSESTNFLPNKSFSTLEIFWVEGFVLWYFLYKLMYFEDPVGMLFRLTETKESRSQSWLLFFLTPTFFRLRKAE